MVGGGRGVGAAEGVVVQNSLDTNAILQAINSGTLQTIQGQNGTNITVERAAASTFNGITQQNTQNLLASVQGFCWSEHSDSGWHQLWCSLRCVQTTVALERSAIRN